MSIENEQQLAMQKHGITREEKFVYTYKNFKYDDLQQAINFAVFQQAKNKKSKNKS